MNIRKILSRRDEIRTELRNILDAAPDGTLAPDAEARAAQLETEAEALNVAERRAGLLADLDQRAEAKPLEQRGADDDGASVFGLKPEQRMAQYVERTTGEPTAGLSVGRVVRGLVTGKWDGADAERRAMGTTIGTAGGYLIPEPISANITDLARNASVVVRAGALTIPMANQHLRVVEVLTDPTAAWRAEGAAITESEGTFGALNLTAHSLAAMVRVNNELIDDAPMFAATLDQQLAAILALKLDYAALLGTGAGMPQGLRHCSGVNEVSMGANGLAMANYDNVLDLIQAIEEDNGAPTVAVMAPRTRTKLAKLVTGITSDLTKLVPPAEYTALRRLVSNQVSITETQGSSGVASTMFLGDFSQMALAIRQGITVEATRVADDAFSKNQTLVRAIMRADVAVFRPGHFGRLIGIL
jgi:HK97 family phage major capsid protein